MTNPGNGHPTAAEASSGAVAGSRLRWWVAPMAAGTLAALVRLVHVIDLRAGLGATQPLFEGAIYDAWARGALGSDAVLQHFAPLLVWWLRLVHTVADGVLAAQIGQALMGAVTASLVADLGQRRGGPVAGLAAGLLLAMCWPAVFFVGELIPATLFTMLVVGAIWLLTIADASDRPGAAIAGALVLGLSVLARPIALVLVPALAVLPLLVWSMSPRVRLGRWRRRGAAVLVGAALLPLSVFVLANSIGGRGAGFAAVQPALALYAGNHAGSDGHTNSPDPAQVDRLAAHRAAEARVAEGNEASVGAASVGAHHLRLVAQFWQQDPAGALRLQATKLRALVGGGERGDGKNLHFWRARTRVLAAPIYTSWAPILALGLVGLWLGRRAAWTRWWVVVIVSFSVALVLTVVNEAARLPLTALLAVPAGIAIAQVLEHVRRRAVRPALGILGAVVILAVASALDRIDLKEARIDTDAASHRLLGDLLVGEGRLQEAAAAYQTALTIAETRSSGQSAADDFASRGALVRALFGLHLFENADQHLRILEATHPDEVEVLVLRGRYHLWHHDEAAAFPYFRRAVDLRPDDPDALLGLVWCQIANKAFVTARQNVERVLAMRPELAEAIAAKGVIVLHGERNPRHAKQLFEQALRIDWETAAAHHFLGVVFNGDNNRARALYHFRETMRLDPHNEWVSRFLNRSGLEYEHPAGTTRPEL